jgi:hypothetical protein
MNKSFSNRLQARYASWQTRRRIDRLARDVVAHSRPRPGAPRIAMFNATARLTGLSLNAAFSLLLGWGLRLGGAEMRHFVCRSGLDPCVLGTSRENYSSPPPCQGCLEWSNRLYQGASERSFGYSPDQELQDAICGSSLADLSSFEYDPPDSPFSKPAPLGRLAMPALRWALRQYNLPEDGPDTSPPDSARGLLQRYILSAWNTARQFNSLMEEFQPDTALIFNGIMYPEAAARWAAADRGVRSVSYEVGFQRNSVFFTDGEVTAYPIHIPDDFELSPAQEARLDAYLEQRFQGKFSMAGIQFWPEMHGLDPTLLEKIAAFDALVPVFTNVIYDTSQAHANVVFSDMFAWLEQVLELAKSSPRTLFVIRAHPDEFRPGTHKLSRESVRDFLKARNATESANIVFIDSNEYVSSYELIGRSKFVMVYNSSIGLEAVLMGKAVLAGGHSRYTQYPIVDFPQSPDMHHAQAQAFLAAEFVMLPDEFRRNARRFMYYQLFRASLPLDRYIQAAPRQGFVNLTNFSWRDLLPENAPTLRILLDGLQGGLRPDGTTFLLPE